MLKNILIALEHFFQIDRLLFNIICISKKEYTESELIKTIMKLKHKLYDNRFIYFENNNKLVIIIFYS